MRPHILARRLALLRKRSFIARPLYASASPSSTHNAPFLPVGRSRWIPQTRNYAVAVEKEASDEPEVLPITTPVPGAAFLQRDLREIYAFLDKEIGGTSLWRDRIRDISEDLRALRRGRIAILGESLAVPHDVVTAMLQDPLNHSKGAVAAIQSRYQATQPDVLRITSDGPNSSIGTYSTDSPFLQNAGYDIMEISPTAPDIPSLLLSADATVVVVDPIRLLDSPFMTRLLPIIFAGHPLHIVVNGDIPSGTSPSALQDVVQSRINQWLADSGNNNESNFNRPRIFFVHADKALHAINFMALGATQDPSSSTDHARAVALYQTTFAESNLGPFLTSLVAQCRAAPMPQLSSAYRLASLALDHARSVIMADRRTTDSAGRTVAELRRSARQSISRARHMSVITKSIEGGIIAEGVETEMTALKLEMQERFKDRWSWLALVLRLRVDDVGVEVGGHVQQFLGSTLARTITFETGEMAQLQRQLGSETDHIVHQLSMQPGKLGGSQPFFSPLLINSLSTLALSVPELEPTSLTAPIESRREQILATSVPRLQVSASRSLLASWIFSGTAALLSWTAYVPPVALISAPTAVGLAILGLVGSLSAGQRTWLRAQNRFWRDWDRINAMLRGDLETRLNTLIDAQVAAKPLAAADGLEQLVAKRQTRLDALQARVGELQARLYPPA